jgi:hypothetical protein
MSAPSRAALGILAPRVVRPEPVTARVPVVPARAAYASVAAASVRSDDQLLDLLLALSAERARQKAAGIGHLPTVSTEIG